MSPESVLLRVDHRSTEGSSALPGEPGVELNKELYESLEVMHHGTGWDADFLSSLRIILPFSLPDLDGEAGGRAGRNQAGLGMNNLDPYKWW